MKKETITFYVQSAAVCHMGRVRKNNEDNIYYKEQYLSMEHIGMDITEDEWSTDVPKVVGVFDGMGGESNGELASFTAVKSFANWVNPLESSYEYLESLFNKMNLLLCDTAHESRIVQMGTTASVLFVKENKAVVSNVGDSPIFLCRDGKLHRVFQPHTNEALLKANNINRKPALTQFLGLDHDGMLLEPYVQEMKLQDGDYILVTSDGLTDMMEEKEIEEILNRSISVKEKLSFLLNTTLERGAKDNTTMILCRFNKRKREKKTVLSLFRMNINILTKLRKKCCQKNM